MNPSKFAKSNSDIMNQRLPTVYEFEVIKTVCQLFKKDKEAIDFMQLDRNSGFDRGFVKKITAMFVEMVKQDFFLKGL